MWRAEHKKDDISNLKTKVDCGVDFLTTQMFFDNNIFYNFLYRIREKGILVPVLPGIMPVTNKKQLRRSMEYPGQQFRRDSWQLSIGLEMILRQ